MQKYVIFCSKGYYFLNLIGQYSLVEDRDMASKWTDINDKEMWFFLHELVKSTKMEWRIRALNDDGTIEETLYRHCEPQEARKFLITKLNTIESVQDEVVLEEKTFNEKKLDPNKVSDVYYAELLVDGVMRYIPVTKIGPYYYRSDKYVLSLNSITNSGNLWE